MATVGPAPDIGNIGADGQANPQKVRGLGVSRGLSTDGAVPGLHPNRVRYFGGRMILSGIPFSDPAPPYLNGLAGCTEETNQASCQTRPGWLTI